jgi:hypothetical protein
MNPPPPGPYGQPPPGAPQYNPYGAPLPPPPPPDGALSGLIPYNNGAALGGYYCGIFAIIPCLGAVLGPIAVVLGIIGLKNVAREPQRKGKVHAWIGVIAGGLFGLVNLAVGVIWLIMILAASSGR